MSARLVHVAVAATVCVALTAAIGAVLWGSDVARDGEPLASVGAEPGPSDATPAVLPAVRSALADDVPVREAFGVIDRESVTDGSEEGDVPDAVRGQGRLTLRLQLVDEETGGPVTSQVRLWRLGIFESDGWSAGDHVQARGAVRGMAEFRDLPVGTYRVEIEDLRAGVDDPPEFEVRASVSQKLTCAMPRTFPLLIEVVDEEGRPIVDAQMREGGSGGSFQARAVPSWACVRQPLQGPWPDFGGGWIGTGCSPGGRVPHGIRAGPGGFALGEVTESSRGRSDDCSFELTIAGRSAVDLRVDSDRTERGRFIAVSVPTERLAARVRLPDGRAALVAGALVEARCNAIGRPDGAPPDLWRSIPVRVTVLLTGYDEQTFDWRAADTSAEPIVLVPTAK